MAELFNIMKVTVGASKLRARVLVNPGMPLLTSENVEATARVYYLAPAIADHLCTGDAGPKFQDCMGHTELAHLLEHLTVEVMNETGLVAGAVSGRTRADEVDPRLFDVELACPDDALAIGALSSAMFMMNWAFLHADQTPPDMAGTVAALRHLVLSLRGEQDEADSGAAAGATAAGADDGTYAEQPMVIDTEGASVQARDDVSAAVFGGAAAGEDQAAQAPASTDAPEAFDPDATAAMPVPRG